MKIRALTDAEKGLIVGMHKAGTRSLNIAKQLSMPPTTIYTILQNFKRRGTVVSPKPPGRPRKFTERNLRHLERVLHVDRHVPLMEITNQMADVANVSCCNVRNAMNSLGYRNCVPAKKPFLIEKQKAGRLAFAKKHRHWTQEDWKKVIWTDESCFEVGKNSRQIRVWQKPLERY